MDRATESKFYFFTFFKLNSKSLWGELFAIITFKNSAVFKFSQSLQKLKSKENARFGSVPTHRSPKILRTIFNIDASLEPAKIDTFRRLEKELSLLLRSIFVLENIC